MATEKVNWVFQDWLGPLPMQMQSVLVLACRGPDGIAKYNRCKEIIRRYRATILKSAYYGRPLPIDRREYPDFMSLKDFSDGVVWAEMMKWYFETVDTIPHHYHLHLLHGAEIIGYHHPVESFRLRWLGFYAKGCEDMHVEMETKERLDVRLGDWGQKHWEEELR